MAQKRVCVTCKNSGCVAKCRFKKTEPVRFTVQPKKED